MLLRNLDPSEGLCNGTIMVCKEFEDNVIHAEIIVGHHVENMFLFHEYPCLLLRMRDILSNLEENNFRFVCALQ